MVEIIQLEAKCRQIVYEYCYGRIKDDRLAEVIKRGLNSFAGFPFSSYCSLYLLNSGSLEFEFSSCSNNTFAKSSENIFAYLIKRNIVGKSLKTAKPTLLGKLSKKGYYYFSLPLVSLSGPQGIIIIGFRPQAIEFLPVLKAYMVILSSIFASDLGVIESTSIHDDYNDILTQQVASQTINLVENNIILEEKIETLRTDLTSAIPHEVRTPIFNIMGFTDLLLKNMNSMQSDEVISVLNEIKDSSGRLHRLFENYLLYTKLTLIANDINELNKCQNHKTISVYPIIYDKIIRAAEKENRLEDFELDLTDACLNISEKYLSKLVEEIVDNCLKYSNLSTKIIINSGIDGNYYKLYFENEGRVISENQINNIGAYIQFERDEFEQQGSGLGLSIVQKILDIYKGKLQISTKYSKYTSVEILIPIIN